MRPPSIRRGRCPHRPVFQCNDHMDVTQHDDIFVNVCILMFYIDIVDVLLGDCPNFTQKNRRGDVGIAPYGPQNIHGAMWASSPYGAHTLNWNLSFLCLKIAMNKMFISFASMTVLDLTMFLCHLAYLKQNHEVVWEVHGNRHHNDQFLFFCRSHIPLQSAPAKMEETF